jgi:hypothetical protein
MCAQVLNFGTEVRTPIGNGVVLMLIRSSRAGGLCPSLPDGTLLAKVALYDPPVSDCALDCRARFFAASDCNPL